MDLRALALGARALQERTRRSPVDHVPWLPAQIEFLRHVAPEPVLYRAGNRGGKSTVGCGELIFRARGEHPHKPVPPGPVRLALVCSTKLQSIEIQRVLWELLGGTHSEDLAPGTEFSSRTGFRGHRPVIAFVNGSEIHVYGNAQGAGAIAGAEYDGILLDEPPAEEVYDECRARLRNTGGWLGLTLTPINGPPLPWLRELCAAGRVRDIHARLTPESQISPLTGVPRRTRDGRAWDAALIRELEETENPVDAPIRLHGDWESRTVGQFFACFDSERHVTAGLPEGVLRLLLGIDYAAADRELGMCAVLSAVESIEEEGSRRRLHHVYALDEVVVPGTTTMEGFARAILRMLADHRIRWRELDQVLGDNPIRSRHVETGNRELARWIARGLQVHQNALRPRVLSAKEKGGRSGAARRSKDIRCRWMYGEIGSDRVRVHPRCETLIRALQEWDYGDRHRLKDVLDAWMYGLRDLWAEAERWGDLPARVRIG